MFQILLSGDASQHLSEFRKYDQQKIRTAIRTQLTEEPGRKSRNRKLLRPNPLAEWELRVGIYRVFYDIDEADGLVKVKAVGHKEGSKLLVHGKEFKL